MCHLYWWQWCWRPLLMTVVLTSLCQLQWYNVITGRVYVPPVLMTVVLMSLCQLQRYNVNTSRVYVSPVLMTLVLTSLCQLQWYNVITIRVYVSDCSKCGPRLSPQAAEKLKNRYVLMRNSAASHEKETGKRTAIPITVRCALFPCHESSKVFFWLV